ncbi:MAG: hypothetical protein KIT33_14485 [Candidatus Kapabacteria bacterium]|nr:hypothetical protein [Ignavibacteriota bacterium]MCW5886174.1 hypothetical protein [Candidatus Kapabacteria bacterium]
MNYLILFLLVFSCSNLLADDCGVNLKCDESIKYPYHDCLSNVVCTNEPLGLNPPVRRGSMPICSIIDHKDGPGIIQLPTMTGLETVFDATRIQEDINCAQRQWNCVCGKQDASCSSGCQIKLRWSKKASDFSSPTTLAYAESRWSYGIGHPCIYNCSTSNITLNNSDSWRGKKIDGFYAKSFCQYDSDYYTREPDKGYNT